MISLNIKEEVIRPLILKRDGYKCTSCNVEHQATVYENSRKEYVVCDEFMTAWALANGFNVYNVRLHVVKLNPLIEGINPDNFLLLCPRCSKKFKQEQKKKFRNELSLNMKKTVRAGVKSKDIKDISLYTNIQKSIFTKTGIELSLSTIEQITHIISNK